MITLFEQIMTLYSFAKTISHYSQDSGESTDQSSAFSCVIWQMIFTVFSFSW